MKALARQMSSTTAVRQALALTPTCRAMGNNITNNIWMISDSINSFYRCLGQQQSQIHRDQPDQPAVFTTTNVTFSNSMSHVGGNVQTEEDPFGDQPFAINGAISYYGHNQSTLFIFGGTTGWRNINGQKFSSNCSSMTASGTNVTQTGMDIVTTIDTSRRVYFGDWGHDDGGLFGFGNDDQLGLRRTNIRKLNSSSTPSSSKRRRLLALRRITTKEEFHLMTTNFLHGVEVISLTEGIEKPILNGALGSHWTDRHGSKCNRGKIPAQ